MSAEGVARAVRLRLAAELAGERASLRRLASSIAELKAPATEAPAVMRTLALAFQLERFYTAVESVLSRILRTVDGDVPVGPDSHVEILLAASVEVEGLRPAVLPEDAMTPLRELLGFRHYARHGYDVAPQAERIDELATMAVGACDLVERALVSFEASLRAS
jgi:hypothetical protein